MAEEISTLLGQCPRRCPAWVCTLRMAICRLVSGMTGLLDLLGKAPRLQIALDPQSTRYRQSVFRRGLIERAHEPKRMRAILRERPPVQAHVVGFEIGLDRLGAHRLYPADMIGVHIPNDKRGLFGNLRPTVNDRE